LRCCCFTLLNFTVKLQYVELGHAPATSCCKVISLVTHLMPSLFGL
jgi:hypothetical protein